MPFPAPLAALLLVQSASADAATGPRCASATAPIEHPCTLPLNISARTAASRLGRRHWFWWVAGDQLTLVARPAASAGATLCCAIQMPLEPLVGTDIWGVTVRIPDIDRSFFDVGYVAPDFWRRLDEYRGPFAPPAAARAEPLRGRITGHRIESQALDEPRDVSVYVPPDVQEGERLPVIYLADGATQQYAAVLEAAVAAGHARPALIVGINSSNARASGCARPGHCDRRNLEYLPHFSAAGSGPDSPFGRHLRFVTDELMPRIERDYPASARREDRISAGFSSGAVWALAAASRRPDLFTGVIAMSPGGEASAPEARALGRARALIGAGLYEPRFLESARRWAAAARSGGTEVRHREMASGHTHMMWEMLFAEGVAWLLPPR